MLTNKDERRGKKFMDYLSKAQEKFLRANAARYFDMFDLDNLIRVSEFRPQFQRALKYPLPESGAPFEDFFDPLYVRAYRSTLAKVSDGDEGTMSNFDKLMHTKVIKAYDNFLCDDLHTNETEETNESQESE